jgi:D-serine dehydratase
VIAARVGIYEFLKRWEEMAMMAKLLVKMQTDESKWWIKLAAGTRRHKSIKAAIQVSL